MKRNKFESGRSPEDLELDRKRGNANVATAAAIVGALVIGGPLFGHKGEHKGGKQETKTTLVKPGEMEWNLADRINGNRDPRETVYELDKIIPKDAAHANHQVVPGDRVEYTSDGKVVSYSEQRP